MVDKMLVLSRDHDLNINHFYNLGTILGQGSYGQVEISIRNCQLLTQIQEIAEHDEEQVLMLQKELSYAIKKVYVPQIIPDLPYTDQDEAVIEMMSLNREYQSLASLSHPLISELLETYTDQNCVYMVNQFYTGGELNDLMFEAEDHQHTSKSHHLPELKVKPLIYQVLRAMNYLRNKNILHRDLKPENIMIDSCGNAPFIKIIDFGFSLDLNKEMDEEEQQLMDQVVMGTMTYVAPELIER